MWEEAQQRASDPNLLGALTTQLLPGTQLSGLLDIPKDYIFGDTSEDFEMGLGRVNAILG